MMKDRRQARVSLFLSLRRIGTLSPHSRRGTVAWLESCRDSYVVIAAAAT
jgi:hypothetical protein